MLDINGSRARERQSGYFYRWSGLARWGLFPTVVAAVFAILTALRVSGSSIGVFSASPAADGLIWGRPLPIRSDEFLLVTPSKISSVVGGFPAEPWVGLSPTDLDVAVHSGVSTSWTTLFHPDAWGYLLAGSDVGLAFSWWWSFAISLWGVYALVGLLTKRPFVAAMVAIFATFTPYSAWWSAAPPSLLLGYAAATGACLIAAWKVRSLGATLSWSFAAGVSAVALALVLYPPWALPCAMVVAAVCLGYQLDRRHSWRRVGLSLIVTLTVAGAVLALWAAQNWPAIEAMTGTYYPGSRVTHGGELSASQLLNGPLNFWMAGAAGDSLGKGAAPGTFVNLSAMASTWAPLPAVALLLVGVAELWIIRWRHRKQMSITPTDLHASAKSETPGLWAITILSLMTMLLLGWAVLPLPDWVGSITQLNKVQGQRLPLAIGFAIALMLALASSIRSRLQRPPRAWTVAWAVAAAIATSALSLWSAIRTPWDFALVSSVGVLASGLVLGAAFALSFCLRDARLPLAVVAIYALASWALVNPVQQGTAPLTANPLSVAIKEMTQGTENPRTVVFGDFRAVAMVRAAGLQSVSGQTPIPSADVMTQIAPDQEPVWNNYVKYRWTALPAGETAEILPIVGTTLELQIDPCAPELRESVDPGWVVSDSPLSGAACLTPIAIVEDTGFATFHVYQVQG